MSSETFPLPASNRPGTYFYSPSGRRVDQPNFAVRSASTVKNPSESGSSLNFESATAMKHLWVFYQHAPVGHMAIDERDVILEANYATTQLLGVSRDRLIGQPIQRFVSRNYQELRNASRSRLLETGTSQRLDLEMITGDGSRFWAHWTAVATRNADGSPLVHIVLTDLSEQIRLEAALQESQDRVKALNDQTSDASSGGNQTQNDPQWGRDNGQLPGSGVSGSTRGEMGTRELSQPLGDENTAGTQNANSGLALEATNRLSSLTAREWQILRLLVAGKSSKMIGNELRISVRTVSNHRMHIMTKSKAENTAELVRLAVLSGIN